jgi:uncharacterized protein YidB (DUF937 family)
MAAVVNQILEQHGGLQGVVSEFEQKGLGPTVRSWVSSGPNQPISADDVQRALGPDLIQQLSQKSGVPANELARKLAEILPNAVDRMTPNGTIPNA